jgi:hypothetical protein
MWVPESMLKGNGIAGALKTFSYSPARGLTSIRPTWALKIDENANRKTAANKIAFFIERSLDIYCNH